MNDREFQEMILGNEHPLLTAVSEALEDQFMQIFQTAVLQCMEQEEIVLDAAIELVIQKSTTPDDPPRKRSLFMECAADLRHYFHHIEHLVQVNASGNTKPKLNLHLMNEEELEAYYKKHEDDGCNFKGWA